jgi:hypothetical protein
MGRLDWTIVNSAGQQISGNRAGRQIVECLVPEPGVAHSAC